MPITDYSTSAASNTLLGTIPVGPNMERNKVNDAIQQLMADIAALPVQTGSELVGFGYDETYTQGTTGKKLQDVALTPFDINPSAVADAVYNGTTKTFSGTDMGSTLNSWLTHPSPIKRLPAGLWYCNTDRLSGLDGMNIIWDADAWICFGSSVDTGGIWWSGLTDISADRIQLDMRGAPWADSGAGAVNDALTIVGCTTARIGLIQVKAVYDSANVDATNCRGDSGLMLSQSTDVIIGTVIGDGLPDTVVYGNGNGQTAGVANSPLTDCYIGRIVGNNCANGFTPKRAADGIRIGEVYADGCDQVVSIEDVAPTVGSARDVSIDRVIGRNVRLNGIIARYADRLRVGYLDIEFAARPAGLSGAAIRCGIDIQGSASVLVENYRVIFDGSDGASQSAAVVIEERAGTVCSDTRILGGFSDDAHWRVYELEATHLRTRVFNVVGTNDGATSPIFLRNSSARFFALHADNSLLTNTDIRFTSSNIGLYARDVDGTYRTLLINAASTALQSSGATVATVDSAGINLASGKVLHVNSLPVVGARGAAVADATGGATVDTEARTAINTLLARLRTHGLIAT